LPLPQRRNGVEFDTVEAILAALTWVAGRQSRSTTHKHTIAATAAASKRTVERTREEFVLRSSRQWLWTALLLGTWRHVVRKKVHRRFGKTYCLNLQSRRVSPEGKQSKKALVVCIFGLHFNSENGVSKFLRNVE
jgi:hypothetical protein